MKVSFIRGVLVFAASHGMFVYYDELRRLARMCDEQLGKTLGVVRTGLAPGEPDICAVVIKTSGKPGVSWGNLNTWHAEVARCFAFYADRRALDNGPFQSKHGMLPTFPGSTL
jgi:hypothetical protein